MIDFKCRLFHVYIPLLQEAAGGRERSCGHESEQGSLLHREGRHILVRHAEGGNHSTQYIQVGKKDWPKTSTRERNQKEKTS